jgi:hypothetical protein
LKEMGGMRALRAASEEDLRALTWLPDRVAEAVYVRLHTRGDPGGITAARVRAREDGRE